jgi:transcriptional regulator
MVLEHNGANGRLKCHISRANPQWRDHTPSVEALAIFSGPHHYITPSWYPEKEEPGKVVPTWNYVVVHAYGHLKVMEDGEWLMAHLSKLTNIHEAGLPVPWKVGDAPADYIASMAKGIVGLEMEIKRIEGKWKLSQNRPEQDRSGVARGLAELNTTESLTMKALVEKRD